MTLIMTSEMADQLVVIVIAGMQFLLQNVEIMEHGKKREMSTQWCCFIFPSTLGAMLWGKLRNIK